MNNDVDILKSEIVRLKTQIVDLKIQLTQTKKQITIPKMQVKNLLKETIEELHRVLDLLDAITFNI